jgi:hypothetical protein
MSIPAFGNKIKSKPGFITPERPPGPAFDFPHPAFGLH